ncbi:hypothetical protein [Streptomyces sp. XY332]|uniref:hypothetical protein n=1 Tax=Streptomyces sp. XY332 TaxID=1415561 RepID=UPI000B1A80A3|nr:hypothetical protein [Streptomyces sp. XY332]
MRYPESGGLTAERQWTLHAQTTAFLALLIEGEALILGDLARCSGLALGKAAALA